MSQLTLYLDKSNKIQFCKWLTDYCQKMRLGNAEYPYNASGVYKIDYPFEVYQVDKVGFSARIKEPPRTGQPPSGVIQINVHDPEENKMYQWWEWILNDVIDMSWIEVGERLKVTISGEDSLWLIPPKFQLLWAMKTDFPETGEIILSYVQEQADWWNLNPPVPDNDAAVAYVIAVQAKGELNKKNSVDGIKKNATGGEDDLTTWHHIIEILKEPYDILDTTLSQSLDMTKSKWINLEFKRNLIATAKVKYLLYIDVGLETGPVYLGYISLRKTQNEITEVIMERLVKGERAIPFVEAVKNWKAYVEFDKKVAQDVPERGIETSKRKSGKSGRPHMPDDEWAWNQINELGRNPAKVFEEWINSEGVKARNLVDPDRQFKRVIKPDWGTKSGQNN